MRDVGLGTVFKVICAGGVFVGLWEALSMLVIYGYWDMAVALHCGFSVTRIDWSTVMACLCCALRRV